MTDKSKTTPDVIPGNGSSMPEYNSRAEVTTEECEECERLQKIIVAASQRWLHPCALCPVAAQNNGGKCHKIIRKDCVPLNGWLSLRTEAKKIEGE